MQRAEGGSGTAGRASTLFAHILYWQLRSMRVGSLLDTAVLSYIR